MQRLRTIVLGVAALGTLAAPAAAQSASGSGQQATSLFPLAAGLTVFEIEHGGAGDFRVRLLDERGQLVEELAQASGAFRGSKAVGIPREGRYLYDVSATGPWSVRVRGGAGSGGTTTAPTDSVGLEGLYGGMLAARGKGTMGWLATGLLSGALAGPVGAGINFAVASRRPATIPAEVLAGVQDRPGRYVDMFSEAYLRRIRSNRRSAALVGGATGTVIFAVAVWQITGGFGRGHSGGGGGPVTELP